MHDRPAQFIRNHDGDTVTMVLDQDFYDRKQINIRLANVWAPDGKQDGVVDVTYFVRDWFMRHMVKKTKKTDFNFIVYTHVTSVGSPLKTFDRYVADVTSLDGKHHLNSDVMKFITDMGYDGGIGAIKRV